METGETLVRVGGYIYCYAENLDDLTAKAQGVVPDFSDCFCELLEDNRKDNIKFDGAGIYCIDYWVWNPCKHGLWARQVSQEEIETLARGFLTLYGIERIKRSVLYD